MNVIWEWSLRNVSYCLRRDLYTLTNLWLIIFYNFHFGHNKDTVKPKYWPTERFDNPTAANKFL